MCEGGSSVDNREGERCMRMYRWYRREDDGGETGFLLQTTSALSEADRAKVEWLIADTFAPERTTRTRHRRDVRCHTIGPRIPLETPFSSNAVSILRSIGITNAVRFEQVRRYAGDPEQGTVAFDPLMQQVFPRHFRSFVVDMPHGRMERAPLCAQGIDCLREINARYGLGMDADDIAFYYTIFAHELKRDPTMLELMQLGNANSEHSRHWFFRGQIVIDGVVQPRTLFDCIRAPYLQRVARGTVGDHIVAFHDNAGVIFGLPATLALPHTPEKASRFADHDVLVHVAMTAETHNHPTFVAPFPGAATGVGGRVRDSTAVGIGAYIGYGAAGYCVANLFLPEHPISGEVVGRGIPSAYAQAHQILTEGIMGASSYGNELGEPTILGFARTFEQRVDGEWVGFRKPVLYTAGTSFVPDTAVKKKAAEVGMHIVRIGGPAYPVGVGGGSASSMMQGKSTVALDISSVQRGNAEMEQRGLRVLRACVEMGGKNPIVSLHDQGAGGCSNVLPELIETLGGTIDIRAISCGDTTMSVLHIWSAEFQESWGILVAQEGLEVLRQICARERVPCDVVGQVTGSGNITVFDSSDAGVLVDLNLSKILSHLPQKTFRTERKARALPKLDLTNVALADAIPRVLQQVSVGSKGFIVNRKDRSVTGRIAQQQCCGIAHIPIADYGLGMMSETGFAGAVSTIGERPLVGLISPAASARLALGEALTNMAGCVVRDRSSIAVRVNWMWPAKLPHEGARLYEAAEAVSQVMLHTDIVANGGKDSLSMAATVAGETVKAPGTVVIYASAPVADVRRRATPEIQRPGNALILLDIGKGKNRLGGSALAQAYNQLGDECPDVDDADLLVRAFTAVQELVSKGLALGVHDIGDGGLFTTVLEMCMASRCGFSMNVSCDSKALAELFNEELGIVLEVSCTGDIDHKVADVLAQYAVPYRRVAITSHTSECTVWTRPDTVVWQSDIAALRSMWEATSNAVARRMGTPACVNQEAVLHASSGLPRDGEDVLWLSFSPQKRRASLLRARPPRTLVVRETGSNGDREMVAACRSGGHDVTEANMEDIRAGEVSLEDFQGLVFVGGFSYMDTLGAGKGWAGSILHNPRVKEQFDAFYHRANTWSLSVCNGCQVAALLGWVPYKETEMPTVSQPRFLRNVSGMFESRYVYVEIQDSPALMFKGMTGSRIPIWSAHGEGRLFYPDVAVQRRVEEDGLVPLVYIDEKTGLATERYPYNPNGSPKGAAGLCSRDGRHLAMMPHPERVVRLETFAWLPARWGGLQASPWLTMFQNAAMWALEHQE